MRRTTIILACFSIYASSISQTAGAGGPAGFRGQYPFVHYTPKDGLVSNQIKYIYQDSRGRLYFSSINGLSVYDGSRFINYTSKNGLNVDIVNHVIEMGDDSIWVVTNSPAINCLVNGKMKTLALKNMEIVINTLCKDEKGDLYATAEQGLFIFDKDHFIKLPFIDTSGTDINFHLAYIFSIGDYLLIQRDFAMLPGEKNPLYLYHKKTQRIVAQHSWIFSVSQSPDNRIWVSTEKKIMALNTAELQKGNIALEEIPAKFDAVKNLGSFFLHFDKSNNCWLGNQSSSLIKLGPDGVISSFTAQSGLSMFYINFILQDREGITWFATNNGGVNKLVHTNFSLSERPYYNSPPFGDIFYNKSKDRWLFYSRQHPTLVLVRDNEPVYYNLSSTGTLPYDRVVETPLGILATGANIIYKLVPKNNSLHEETIFIDSTDNIFSSPMVDRDGNMVVPGKGNVTAVVNGKIIFQTPLPYYADYAVEDTRGNIWVATRASDLLMYERRPDDPSNYLDQKLHFRKELAGISPRSMIIDKNDNIWIGTRNHGINVFKLENNLLKKTFQLTSSSGLSDDFTYHLACDSGNNIWAASPLGLDKISAKRGIPVIENLTKQNNIYQSVFKVVIDKDNIAWGTVSNGLLKVIPEEEKTPDYSPTLMVSMMKAGKDTIYTSDKTTLTHKQNNLTFYFAATSFLDEKQLLYSYRLLGGNSSHWSEPSNIATVSFINLNPGNYSLEIKAKFPARRYPDEVISYEFSIAPPWWKTWWFRSFSGMLITVLLIIGFRFYYRRKLEKQMAILEKQQAIEKERTRIATDMHDDLGAGLSRIKFLSETIGIKKQQKQSIDEEVTSIRNYSHEMIDKMGEIVWALNEKNDTLSDLLSYTRAYAAEYLAQNGIKSSIEIPDNIPPNFVSGEFRRNIFLTIKEALHNIVKHSQASAVQLSVSTNHRLSISIKDNGVGIDKNKSRQFSNGLTNMRSRIQEMNGRLEIKNENGTMVNIQVPLQL